MGDNNFRENIKYDPRSHNYPFDLDEWTSDFLDKKNTNKPKVTRDEKSGDKQKIQERHGANPFISEVIERALEDKGII